MALEAIPFKSSSHIKSVEYDEETQELVVGFGKSSYLYSGVSPQVANGFSEAVSAGGYLDTFIKGTYPYKKL